VSQQVDEILRYHERTKHYPGRYAAALGYMDWETQPDPFRRFEGAPLTRLELVEDLDSAGLGALGDVPAVPLDRRFVSQLLMDSLGLSAWKQAGEARWALRCNPSSGNLHPTEGYVLLRGIEGVSERPSLFHYAPKEHALELRGEFDEARWRSATDGGPPVLVGLTSIHLRESWKYGERAFRYCQHDVGHAIGAIAYAAAVMGWRVRPVPEVGDWQLSALLGIASQDGPEAEHPDLLLALWPGEPGTWDPAGLASLLPELRPDVAASLSSEHHPWPAIDAAARACLRPEGVPPVPKQVRPVSGLDEGPPARLLIRRRRSAVAMDARTGLSAGQFFAMLRATMPDRMPCGALPGRPAVHLALYVNRIDGLHPGMYLLIRDRLAEGMLRDELSQAAVWEEAGPEDLPLHCLTTGDSRGVAQQVSCGQAIASDGAFAVSMLAEFEPVLRREGAWAYRRLHWEAGLIGQILYLEAEAAGVQSTGIGCFFDDSIHRLLGLRSRGLQSLYNFTVGGAVLDERLQTLDAYHHLV
jgi:SagB-type dehydrogenase family enzyme